MGYADIGNASARPVFFLHGTPSSRHEGLGLAKLAASKSVDVRVITPDRPGIGLSTPKPGRKLIEYPFDILELGTHLGIDTFSIIGGSGGAPSALACAFALPPHQIRAVGILAGMGQARRGAMAQLRWQNRLVLFLTARAPWRVSVP